MSYFVNTNCENQPIHCDKCSKKIGVAKGFYCQWGRILCCICQEQFVEFVKEKYNEFISEPQWKEYQTSPQMDLFFKRLSDIKARLKLASENHPDPVTKDFSHIIYQQLHELYKASDD